MPKASDKTKPPRPKSAVLDSKEKVVAALLDGASVNEAARAGDTTLYQANSPDVKAALAIARSDLVQSTKITKERVTEGIIEAIEMAKLCADPGAMIRGWSELAKIHGHYAPEVKKVEVTATLNNRRSKFEMMSDEELEALARGETIDGESTRLDTH